MYTAFIPAKGSSQRVPNKNLQVLNGLNLVNRAIRLSISSKLIGDVVLSTDSSDIVENSEYFSKSLDLFSSLGLGESKRIGNRLLLHKRRSKHSTASARTVGCVIDFLDSAEDEHDFIALLQPTSPFRNSSEIQHLHTRIMNEKLKSIFSVRKADSPHPQKTFKLTLSGAIEINSSDFTKLSSPAQELGDYFAPDGAYYFATSDQIYENQSLISQDSQTYLRSGTEIMNIDSLADLEYAKFLAISFDKFNS